MHFRFAEDTRMRELYRQSRDIQKREKEGARKDGIRDGISFMLYALWMWPVSARDTVRPRT